MEETYHEEDDILVQYYHYESRLLVPYAFRQSLCWRLNDMCMDSALPAVRATFEAVSHRKRYSTDSASHHRVTSHSLS